MSLDNAGQCARTQWESGVSLRLFVGESPGLSAQGGGLLCGSKTQGGKPGAPRFGPWLNPWLDPLARTETAAVALAR